MATSLKTLLSIYICLVTSLGLWAQKKSIPTDDTYHYHVDLNRCQHDQLKITLEAPKLKGKKAIFQVPKTVPGTYSISDFGRYIQNVKAFDIKGEALPVAHPDANTWEIRSAKKLHKLTYTVRDTWDEDQKLFEPAGSNILEGKNFVINPFCWFGFFKGYELKPFRVTIEHPTSMYGGTALDRDEKLTKPDTDVFVAENYHYLADGPILYCKPDTTHFKVAYTDVLVSVYSPNGRCDSKALASDLQPLLEAQKDYLGGTLPATKYAFLVVLQDKMTLTRAMGALEHSYSSLYSLEENEPENIAQVVKNVASHEFFHIVTPLNIHSEEIHYFDYLKPKMSKHLWLYEGVTEYSCHHAQVKSGITTADHFFKEIGKKMRDAESLYKQGLSFTDMSSGVLDTFAKEYMNVYAKGALISLALDMTLLDLSEGKYGIQKLMQDLSRKYGKDRPFKDDKLFDEIAKLTYPEIRTFFKKYVEDTIPLPIPELCPKFGLTYHETGGKEIDISTLGGIEDDMQICEMDFAYLRFKIKDTARLNDFGRDSIGFKQGDIIMDLNGIPLSPVNQQKFIEFMYNAKEGDQAYLTILRDRKAVELDYTIRKTYIKNRHVINLDKKVTPRQLMLRYALLGQCLRDPYAEKNE